MEILVILAIILCICWIIMPIFVIQMSRDVHKIKRKWVDQVRFDNDLHFGADASEPKSEKQVAPAL